MHKICICITKTHAVIADTHNIQTTIPVNTFHLNDPKNIQTWHLKLAITRVSSKTHANGWQ